MVVTDWLMGLIHCQVCLLKSAGSNPLKFKKNFKKFICTHGQSLINPKLKSTLMTIYLG